MKIAKFIATNGLVFLVLVLVMLGAVEVYLRLTIPGSSDVSIFEWTLDNTRYKVMKKNFRMTAWGEELRTNNLGFRDNRDTVPPKADDEFRVIVIGDSSSISGAVPYDKIYSSLLKQRVAEKYANSDVINLAVGGYNPVQYQAVLEEVGLGLQPDLIVLALTPDNDFNRGREATQDLNYRRAAYGENMPKEHEGFRALFVYRAFLWRIEARLAPLFAGASKKSDSPKDDSGWRDNLDAVRLMTDRAAELDIPFIVVLLPPNWNYVDHRKFFSKVRSEIGCESKQFKCVDALEAFIASGNTDKSYWINLLDSHPNARYHALVTEVLAPYVLELVPGD